MKFWTKYSCLKVDRFKEGIVVEYRRRTLFGEELRKAYCTYLAGWWFRLPSCEEIRGDEKQFLKTIFRRWDIAVNTESAYNIADAMLAEREKKNA